MAEKKIICRAQVIKDFNAGQLIPRDVYNPYDIVHMINPYNNSIYSDGRPLPGAAYKEDERRYHHWDNLNRLQYANGEAQCGQPVKAAYRDDVVDGIHYYRDTGAIAGCSGTFCKPATLQFAKFDFRQKGLNEHHKITSVGVVFQHRRTAVATPDDGTPPYECVRPQLNKSLGLALDGLDIYPQYKTLKHWLAIGPRRITHIFGENERIPNPPHKFDDNTNQPVWQKWSGRHIKEDNPELTIENLLNDDFCLYMDYGVNLMGERGILYLKDVYLEIFYEEGKPYISHYQSEDEIKTSKYSKCRTKTQHHIISGFKDSKNFPIKAKKPFEELTPKERDEQYCFHHVKVRTSTIPKGVTVKKIPSPTNNKTIVVYEVEDSSGEEGEKSIEYYLDNHGLADTITFKSIAMERPVIDLMTTYKKRAPYVPGTQYITLQSKKNGCCDTVKIYFDTINSTPLTFNINYLADNVNMLNYNAQGQIDDTYIQQFYNKVQTLSCGKHKLFIQIGSETPVEEYVHAVIDIVPQVFAFSIYDPNNSSLTYNQNKDSPNQTLKIKRIDSEPSESISITINDESKLDRTQTTINNVKKGVEYSYNTSKYYPGKFNITVEEATHDCAKGKAVAQVTVNPTAHRQYHDQLFVRGEDSTSFKHKYLVAWEGDNIKFPITVDSVEKGHSINDILLCSKKQVNTGLSQTGIIPLTVRNIGDSGVIKNCQIELNVLDKLEDGSFQVTTEDWTQTDGIFYNFYKKFQDYNKDIIHKIELRNIDENNNVNRSFSITGEENVYIRIKEIPEDESITINIPFSSRNPKAKYLEYRIFQDVVKFNTTNCNAVSVNQEDKVTIYVYDSILTDLSIEGKTDILNPATTKQDCPNVCYKTEPEKEGEPDGITYRVVNIDSSNYVNAGIEPSNIAPLKIENSMEMVPYAYKLKDGNKTNLGSNQTSVGKKLIFKQQSEDKEFFLGNELINAHVQFSKSESPKIIRERTNNDGEAIFNIEIPRVYNKNYTIEELLSDVVYIEYPGGIEYLPSSIEIGNLKKLETRVRQYGVLYNKKVYLTSNTNQIPANKSVQLLYCLEYKKDNKWYLLNDKTVFLYQGTKKEQIIISSNKSNYNIVGGVKTTQKVTAKQLLSKYDIVFTGDALYQKYNPKKIIINDPRDKTIINFVDDWKVYKPGQFVRIKVELHAITDIIKNYIIFNAELDEPTSYDEVTIYYKMCNLQEYQCNIGKINFDKARLCEKNKGIFTTTFSTDTYKLVQNEISKNIYCGIDNDINLVTKLERKTIQSGNINVIYLNLFNNIKDSKDVKVYIDLGKQPDEFLGDYDYLNIDNTDGDFSYNIEKRSYNCFPIKKYNVTKLIWAIGDMMADTQAKAIIKIKADHIGLSDIKIQVEDYNHSIDNDKVIEVGRNPCKDWKCNS